MKAKLQAEMKNAMKAKDQPAVDTIRMILAAMQYEEMQKGVDSLPENVIIEVLQREVKKRKEEIDFAVQSARSDAKEKAEREIKIIETFLPSQLSSEKVEEILRLLKSSNPTSNMGLAMKHLKENFAGQYDAKVASDVAKRVFG